MEATLLKLLIHYLLPLSEFVRALGWALKAQRKQVNRLREELYNEQMSSQGSTEGFITWTIRKKARYKEIGAFLVERRRGKQRPERKRRPRSATGGSGWPTCLIHPFIHPLSLLPSCLHFTPVCTTVLSRISERGVNKHVDVFHSSSK
jgi:hypothetical protein